MTEQRMVAFGALILIFATLEFYVFGAVNSIVSASDYKIYWLALYVGLSALGYFGLVYAMMNGASVFRMPSTTFSLLLGFGFTMFVTKLIFSGFMAVQDIGRLFAGAYNLVASNDSGDGFVPSRRQAISLLAAGAAAVPFFSMLYGITKGKYQFTVNKQRLGFSSLPDAFKGFKIVQISDIHAGSWDDKEEVARGIQMIQDQKPDMIVFTGDLVNSHKDEIDPFMDIFASLDAPYGKFAILGNHDYYGGRYYDGEEEKKAYWDDFYSKFEYMGFDLIMNDHRRIEKDGQHFNLLGVENWGSSRHFPKKGDLDKSIANANLDTFNLLLSHDPTHWEQKVLEHPQHIDLTLSGHTHGMQFGIKLPGMQWSPVQYRYKRWLGLYEEKDQKLYVNRGFGYLGFPGRVGMWPEITVLELDTV